MFLYPKVSVVSVFILDSVLICELHFSLQPKINFLLELNLNHIAGPEDHI
jgi:hypothetical protein